jgi:hypothetical protein
MLRGRRLNRSHVRDAPKIGTRLVKGGFRIILLTGILVSAAATGATLFTPALIEAGITRTIATQQAEARTELARQGASATRIDTEMQAIDERVRVVNMSGSWKVSRFAVIVVAVCSFVAGALAAALGVLVWSGVERMRVEP